jgi:hypothetical protein
MAAQGSGSDEVLQADSTPRSWCSTKGNLVVRRGASGGVTDHTATGLVWRARHLGDDLASGGAG